MVNANVTTIDVSGETKIEFANGYPYYFITNKSSSDMYASLSPDITPEAEGVYTITAGSTERIGAGYQLKKFYIKGTGKAYIQGSTIAMPPSFKRGQKGGEGNVNIKLGGLVEHITGSPGWKIDVNGSSTSKNASEHCITYYKVAEGLTIYVKAEDDSNECKFIWSKSEKADVTSNYPNPSLIGIPVTDVVNGIVTVPEGAKYICFSQNVSDTVTGVYKIELA